VIINEEEEYKVSTENMEGKYNTWFIGRAMKMNMTSG